MQQNASSSAILWQLRRHPLRPCQKAGFGVGFALARRKSPDNLQTFRLFWSEEIGAILQLMSNAQRCPEILWSFSEALKFAPDDTDDLHRVAADRDFRANNVRAPSEHALPCLIAKHDVRSPAGSLRIYGQQRTA